MSSTPHNPLLDPTDTPHGAIPFDRIELEHFVPALDRAIAEANAALDSVASSAEPPTFENSVQVIGEASDRVGRVLAVYFGLMGANSDDEFKALIETIGPKSSEFSSRVSFDPDLFRRVDAVHRNAANSSMNAEQRRLTELTHRGFVLSGALLDDEEKARLREINAALSQLQPKFSQNVLKATNAFLYHTDDEGELRGLPVAAIEAAAHKAKERGYESGWAFTLQDPSVAPILEYAESRALREKMARAKGAIAFGGEYDNTEILRRIATLFHEKANLLGFATHAELEIQERMADSVDEIRGFLNRIYEVARPVSVKELEELMEYARKIDGNDELRRWDYAYYARKLREEIYDFNEDSLRPYFKAESAISGVFSIAAKLYGIEFRQLNDVPLYHSDVTVYGVLDENGNELGLLYLDLFPRETKSGAAFTGRWRGQGLRDGAMQTPLLFIVANLTPSTPERPALLTPGEVDVLFHEFGHALHALLSKCTYGALASPNVYWDFVELPSQIMENWVREPEALDLFAKHYETGEAIPSEFARKLKETRKFHAGIRTVRRFAQEDLDLAWFASDPRSIDDIVPFEKKVTHRGSLFPDVPGSCLSTSFEHIFAANYSAGYYSYRWAEALEADAFSRFEEEGIFNQEVAASFRENILAQGNKEEPMVLFERFRGRKPDADALLRRLGLIVE